MRRLKNTEVRSKQEQDLLEPLPENDADII
jgi:hypothetical protein